MIDIQGIIQGESGPVLNWLFEMYSECAPCDNDKIKADFDALYQAMNGMELADMDQIIFPVCTLCRDHENRAFADGVRLGVQLALDLRLKDP